MASNYEPGKLFVGGLSWETTKETLTDYFSKFGEVEDCVIMKSQETNRPRGFGFVQFKEPHSVDAVLSCQHPHIVDKKTVDPKRAQAKGQTSPSFGSSNGIEHTERKVFIGGVPTSATEENIKAVFSEAFGSVAEVVLKQDKVTNKMRGFGFVAFDDQESASKAVQQHYIMICEKKIEIKQAEPRQSGNRSQLPNPQVYGMHAVTQHQYAAWNNGPSRNFSGYPTGYNYQTAQPAPQYGGGFPTGYNSQQYGGGYGAAHQRFSYDYSTQQHAYPQDTSSYGAANPTSYPGEYNSAAAAAAGYGYTPDQTNQYHHYDQTTGVASAAGYPRAAQTQQRVTPAAGAYTNFGATR